MTQRSLISRIDALKPWLASRGVAHVRLFGSQARGDAGPGSDIDLIVEFAPGRVPGLFEFAGLKRDLEARLGATVDLFTPDSLHPVLRAGDGRASERPAGRAYT